MLWMDNMEGLLAMVIIIYLVCHLPAIIALIVGLVKWKSNRSLAKKLLIFSAIYFIVGFGVCTGGFGLA